MIAKILVNAGIAELPSHWMGLQVETVASVPIAGPVTGSQTPDLALQSIAFSQWNIIAHRAKTVTLDGSSSRLTIKTLIG